MIRAAAGEIRLRAERLVARLDGVQAEILPGKSVIGGGSTPAQEIGTWVIAIASNDVTGLERRLRTGDPPVLARIEHDRLLLDLRTVFPEEEGDLAAALRACTTPLPRD
jgi:L-seryl-tRNA(Ser) seleniumtransferase